MSRGAGAPLYGDATGEGMQPPTGDTRMADISAEAAK
jgi:hypothetical protein